MSNRENIAPQASTILELKGVCKDFRLPTGGTLRACNKVNITLERGESLGIVGESGSGKSTLARMIMKMMSLSEGQIIIDGVDISNMNKDEERAYRQKIQMVFQDPSAACNPRMKVKDIILEPLYNFGLLKKGTEEDIVGQYLEMVDLPREFMHRYPHEMSGGHGLSGRAHHLLVLQRRGGRDADAPALPARRRHGAAAPGRLAAADGGGHQDCFVFNSCPRLMHAGLMPICFKNGPWRGSLRAARRG